VTGTVPDQMVNCVLCGGESSWLFSAHDGLRTTDQPFSMLRCGDCGLFSLSPSLTPEEALGHYPADYQPFRSMLGAQLHPWARWLERRHWQLRCRAVECFHRGGALLDVGCGAGRFLDVMRWTGRWQVAGVEVHQEAVGQCRQELGLVIHQGDLSTLDLPSETWDVVTMWEVLEHLPNPIAALEAVARILKPEGVLLLSTPNAEAWQATLWGKWWAGWDIPRHQYVFTGSTLEALLARTGFRVVKRLHLPAERFFMVESCRRRLESLVTSDALLRWCKWLAVAAGVMLWPALRLIDFGNRSSQMVVVAAPVGV
jgi:2-polyprenyl-3-methyl-5-hydroxy-6-metoxy-1,4-benzoquinol methylase